MTHSLSTLRRAVAGGANAVQRSRATLNGRATATAAINRTAATSTPTTSSRVFSSYSSFADPQPTLFPTALMGSGVTESGEDNSASDDKKQLHYADDVFLRNDVKFMGALLGKSIREHDGEAVFQKVETLRNLTKQWREHHDKNKAKSSSSSTTSSAEEEEDFKNMVTFAAQMSNQELFVVSRAFTHFLSICNAAEAHHRSRRVWEELLKAPAVNASAALDDPAQSIRALRDSHDSCGRIFSDLLKEGKTPTEIHQTILKQKVEFVLTAHPTEVNRRTLLDKRTRVQTLLAEADLARAIGGATPYQQKAISDKIEREIGNIWQTDELFNSKPSVQQEASKGTLVIDTVLWEAVPQFLRKLDKIMQHDLGGPQFGLPVDGNEGIAMAPLQFSSWMGGDRDGNPNVTANVTREVCATNRIKAATLYKRDLNEIQVRLSIRNCSQDILEEVGTTSRAPYRAYLQQVIQKMSATQAHAQATLDALQSDCDAPKKSVAKSSTVNRYLTKEEFHRDIYRVHKSLCDTNNAVLADGLVTDLLRKIAVFGLSLCPLDVRQESDRHTEALDCITQYLGLGRYGEWEEEQKLTWLEEQLKSKRPLLRAGEWNMDTTIFTPSAIDTLETFQMVAEQEADSLGAYVISQATTASDVMAVLLLQRDAGVATPLRVAPLFETLDDLEGAPAAVHRLFEIPTYKEHINGKQEIMIGYSDSAKDAGRLAASWSQYKSQEALVEVASSHGVDLTFFHGKGGTVGRGGNPETFKAILAHAPDTINGQFRVTEQGEMIDKNFGVLSRAERTLDIYTAAVLAEQHTHRASPSTQWRDLMEEMSSISCDAYRKIVRHDERFVPYFRSATPELELGSMNIGSRPAKRKATGGVESLRAIPWIFAWMQTRLNLPVWLGVGEAFKELMEDPAKAKQLREMYQQWTAFQTTVDLVEMVLAKSEPKIAHHYDEMLVKDEQAMDLGREIRAVYQTTEESVLKLTEHQMLGENNKILRRALSVRNPYVDALNVMQAEVLKRVRDRESQNKEESPDLRDALRTSITGIANGMGNTG